MYAVFRINEQNDWFLLIWSTAQLGVGVYSLLLTFGSVPLQLVLLYGKLLVRAMIALYVAIALLTLILTLVLGFLQSDSTTRQQTLSTLLVQLGLNMPTCVLMIPLWFYMNQCEKYLEVYYPNLMSLPIDQFL